MVYVAFCFSPIVQLRKRRGSQTLLGAAKVNLEDLLGKLYMAGTTEPSQGTSLNLTCSNSKPRQWVVKSGKKVKTERGIQGVIKAVAYQNSTLKV